MIAKIILISLMILGLGINIGEHGKERKPTNAWTSFDKLAKIFKMPTPKDGKIHPTQKPIQLYKWLLHNYTSEGDLILDTHLGSGSIAIACHQMKRKLIGYEIDADYYQKACKRFEEQTRQTALW